MTRTDDLALRQRHLPQLDGLRGVAILLVLWLHWTILPPVRGVDGVYAGLAAIGWCGVDLFFVLSGFLITGILLDSRQGSHYFRNFYARRILRIFPLYYGFLFLYFNLGPYVADLSRGNKIPPEFTYLGWFLLYLSNVFIPYQTHYVLPPELTVTWSLAVEEQYYLIWPAVVRWVRPRQLLRVSIAVVVAALGIRLLLLASAAPYRAAVQLTPARMDSLAMGGIAALLARRRGGLGPVLPWARAAAAITGVALACLFWHELALDARAGRVPNLVDPVLTQTAGFSLLAIFFGSLVVIAVGSGPAGIMGRFLGQSWLAMFGRYSYAIYLLHIPVRRFLTDVVLRGRPLPELWGARLIPQLLFGLLGTLLSLALAMLSWRFFESRFHAWKKHFPYAPAPER